MFQVHEDCKLKVPYEDYNMPVPITNSTNPTVYQQDLNRTIHIKQFEWFRMICAGTKYQYPLYFNKTDLLVRCLGKDLIEYEGKTYLWDKFRCEKIPKATAILTKKKCLNRYSIVKIGFKTQDSFVNTYKVCFDMWTKNTLFTWYTVKTPHYDVRQITVTKPTFTKSPLFGEVNIEAFYRRQVSVLT